MKTINVSEIVKIPEEVKAEVNGRKITITGPRGTLKRDFNYISFDFYAQNDGTEVVVESWMGNRRKNSSVRTVATHIKNMITGVTKGYLFKMRFVYNHFPVNASINDAKNVIEIRNFLGEKRVRVVQMKEDVNVDLTGNKDEIQVYGNDLENVSQSAAAIHMCTLVKHKDIRKFLDGIYVSEKGHIVQEE